jgi:two-component system chemotaxis sensor kinase CheA
MGSHSLLIDEYLDEFEDLLSEIEQTFLDLEENNSQEHLWDCLMRNLHSFKGSAQLMGLEPIVSVAHAMETLVSQCRQQGQNIDSAMTELYFNCVDILRDLAVELGVSGTCHRDVSSILRKIDKIVHA